MLNMTSRKVAGQMPLIRHNSVVEHSGADHAWNRDSCGPAGNKEDREIFCAMYRQPDVSHSETSLPDLLAFGEDLFIRVKWMT